MEFRRTNPDESLCHYGIKGQKWGVRKYQNEDGTLTEEGKRRYGEDVRTADKKQIKRYLNDLDEATSTYSIDAGRYADRRDQVDKKIAKLKEKANPNQSKISKLESQRDAYDKNFEEALNKMYDTSRRGDLLFEEASKRDDLYVKSSPTIRKDASRRAGEHIFRKRDKETDAKDKSRTGAMDVWWDSNGYHYKVKKRKPGKKYAESRNGFQYVHKPTKHKQNSYFIVV